MLPTGLTRPAPREAARGSDGPAVLDGAEVTELLLEAGAAAGDGA